jgi:CDP-paratose 2-epimerase
MKTMKRNGKPVLPGLPGVGAGVGRKAKKLPGLFDWFPPGEVERVERVLSDAHILGVEHLKVGVPLNEWRTPRGQEWYEWLLARLAGEMELLPALYLRNPWQEEVLPWVETAELLHFFQDFGAKCPSECGRVQMAPDLFHELIMALVGWRGRLLERDLEKAFHSFAGEKGLVISLVEREELVRYLARQRWFDRVEAVGLEGLERSSTGSWSDRILRMQRWLQERRPEVEVWVTGAGFLASPQEEGKQAKFFLETWESPAEQVFWMGMEDLKRPGGKDLGGYGLRTAQGESRMLLRLWHEGGIEFVGEAIASGRRCGAGGSFDRPVVITGGAGFVGTNLAKRLLNSRVPVLILDNFSRPGVGKNWQWLKEIYGDQVRMAAMDMLDAESLREVMGKASGIFHLAAQVAVTTSLANPLRDFEVNARGTLNLLETWRSMDEPPPLLFTSTNKVYGDLSGVKLELKGRRYEPRDEQFRKAGFNEEALLKFQSPYGCSKGAASQYVLDYARTYGLPGVVFHMSCIYGPHQRGNEDQGWVAHFLIQALQGQPLTIYGDGRQVRDILFVEDLMDAFLLAQENIEELAGSAFNIGGGPVHTVSLLELLDQLEQLTGRPPEVRFENWRPGDQLYYVSDTRRFSAATGWHPKVGIRQGLGLLHDWLEQAFPSGNMAGVQASNGGRPSRSKNSGLTGARLAAFPGAGKAERNAIVKFPMTVEQTAND